MHHLGHEGTTGWRGARRPPRRRGLLNREIAEALFISRKTVDYHLGHVYQKLEVPRERFAEALAAKD